MRPYLILLAEALVFHWRVLFSGGHTIPWDFRYFHLPFAEFQAHCLRLGDLAWWDPFTYFGRPLWANIQVQTFYPPRLVTLLASNLTGGGHLLAWLEWNLVLHIVAGGVFTYWLLRRLEASEPAALLGATVFQLGGFFASQTQHLGVINGGAWTPLVWLAVVDLAARPRWRAAATLAFATAMVVLAGLPSLAAAIIASALLLALGLVAIRASGAWLLASVAGATVWGLLLAAVQLLATAELNFHSIAQYRAEWRATGSGVPWQALVSLAIPNYWGVFDLTTFQTEWNPTFLYLYCSLGALALAVAAAAFRRDRRARLFGVLAAVLCLFLLGSSTPVGRAVYGALPGAVQSAVQPEFSMPAFMLAVAVLAGLGAGAFLKRPALAWLALALVAADLTWFGSGRPMNTVSIAAEPGVTRTAFHGSEELLRTVRALASKTNPPSRIDTLNDTFEWVTTAPLTRLYTGSGYDPMAPGRSIRVRLAFCDGERWGATYHVSKPGSPALDAAGIRYLLSLEPREDEALRLAAKLPGRYLYENPDALPRFFLVPAVRRASDIEQAAALLSDPGFDPRRTAIVEGPVDLTGAAEPGPVRVIRYGESELELEVEPPEPAYLVTSESHYPGWQAWIDGEETDLHHTNVGFRGLAVPAGRHRVTMRFEPAIFGWGMAVSLVALLALVLAWLEIGRPGKPLA